MYETMNSNHYDYFDYIDSDGNIQKYEPDSDMDFIDFKNLMKKEWDEYLNDQMVEPIRSDIKTLFCCY
jgi:hypothetical protein